ncbi:hypothetical protein BDA99DRAFT_562532 [Phascolomyces articulosus]|uniref:C2H2-type domain-containing protein n=1 Tax=Phascolomyces articulosus TaxID=60185 RepID=A0AAD5PBL4_9FUNG|nr:hypothetical protein BDA99DRAFT_562532 [Phascolomyces articulosus]
MPKCPYSACRNRRFRTENAVNAHLKSHTEPLPFTSFIVPNQTNACRQQDGIETAHFDEQNEHDNVKQNSSSDKNGLDKATIISKVDMQDSINDKSSTGSGLKLNDIELRFARASLSAGLSKAKHTEFANILQDAADLVHNTGNSLKISNHTLDGLFTKIDIECESESVPFCEHEFDISAVHGIPIDCIQHFRESYGTIKIVYRDIKKLYGKRVVQDLFTAKWWHELQAKLPVGAIVLALLLSSDETVISGNNRAFAHPLYIKLGNTPKEIRNKGTNRASRVLAYFPILHCPNNNNKLRLWWSSIKCCIIHYCLRIILAPFANRPPYSTIPMKGPYNKIYQVVPALAAYIADLPEQRLMAGNAFDSVPHFSIYDSLLVVTLHQIGGCYTHLLECVQRKLTDDEIDEINSSITNPTYLELNHHRAILLSLIHDKVSPQIVLCLRHFIDFVYQATSKEHSADTIQQMQESLILYNKYSPAIALKSKSKMRFPKNHSLWKYANDIEMRGVVSSYSTEASENQHKQDAKEPVNRTNFNRTVYTGQIGKFKTRFDALFDTYPLHQKNVNRKKVYDDPASLHSTRILSAPLNKGRAIPIATIQNQEKLFKALGIKIREYLDTEIMERIHRRRVKNYPKLTSNSINVYTVLKLQKRSADDGEPYTEQFRASSNYRNREWRDFAQIEGGYYGRLLLFFEMKFIKRDEVKNDKTEMNLQLCLIETYTPVKDRRNLHIPHITGMEVLETLPGRIHDKVKVIPIEKIIRQVHIVPEFSTDKDKYGYYDQYLLNHDINAYSWSENEGVLLNPDENLITWNDVFNSETLG